MNREQKETSPCPSTTTALIAVCTAVAFWENLCGMEGYHGRQWRKHGVAMEILGGEGKTCSLYLHHAPCCSVACCQGVGQSQKRVNVCEADAKKCCWELCETLNEKEKCYEYVAVGLYVMWLCEVVEADKRCSTFPHCFLLTSYMAYFNCMSKMHLHLYACLIVDWWLFPIQEGETKDSRVRRNDKKKVE